MRLLTAALILLPLTAMAADPPCVKGVVPTTFSHQATRWRGGEMQTCFNGSWIVLQADPGISYGSDEPQNEVDIGDLKAKAARLRAEADEYERAAAAIAAQTEAPDQR